MLIKFRRATEAPFARAISSHFNFANPYSLTGEGDGGVAGSASGGADVELIEDGNVTILKYAATSNDEMDKFTIIDVFYSDMAEWVGKFEKIKIYYWQD